MGEVRVAAEIDELDGGAEDRSGFFSLLRAFGGRAVCAGFAARADDEMGGVAGLGFARDDAAATELDVVGVRAEGEKRGGLVRQGHR